MTAIGSVDCGATVENKPQALEIQQDTWLAVRESFLAIQCEIHSQDKKWGIRDHTLGDWQLIATEEDGEVAEAILKGRFADAEHELVQAMAVRLRMIEKVRRMAKGGG